MRGGRVEAFRGPPRSSSLASAWGPIGRLPQASSSSSRRGLRILSSCARGRRAHRPHRSAVAGDELLEKFAPAFDEVGPAPWRVPVLSSRLPACPGSGDARRGLGPLAEFLLRAAASLRLELVGGTLEVLRLGKFGGASACSASVSAGGQLRRAGSPRRAWIDTASPCRFLRSRSAALRRSRPSTTLARRQRRSPCGATAASAAAFVGGGLLRVGRGGRCDVRLRVEGGLVHRSSSSPRLAAGSRSRPSPSRSAWARREFGGLFVLLGREPRARGRSVARPCSADCSAFTAARVERCLVPRRSAWALPSGTRSLSCSLAAELPEDRVLQHAQASPRISPVPPHCESSSSSAVAVSSTFFWSPPGAPGDGRRVAVPGPVSAAGLRELPGFGEVLLDGAEVAVGRARLSSVATISTPVGRVGLREIVRLLVGKAGPAFAASRRGRRRSSRAAPGAWVCSAAMSLSRSGWRNRATPGSGITSLTFLFRRRAAGHARGSDPGGSWRVLSGATPYRSLLATRCGFRPPRRSVPVP